MLQLTALMDNLPSANTGFIAEHGLSFFVEYREKQILFDCGAGENFLTNAGNLGICLTNLDAVVLSHSHYDHAAGYRHLIQNQLGSCDLYTGPGFFQPKYSRSGEAFLDRSAGFDESFLHHHGIRHHQVNGIQELFPGVYLIGSFPRQAPFETIPEKFVKRTPSGFAADDFSDEICMALDLGDSVAVLVGCSHPGIVNMTAQVTALLGKPVRAVFGGTHLLDADSDRIHETLVTLQTMGLSILGLSHCSGENTLSACRSLPGIRCCYLGSGDSICL